jgi:polygalacturonase
MANKDLLKRTKFTLLLLALSSAVAIDAHAQAVCNVRHYGAKGDGITKDTAAIQKAIDDCASKGGGTVIVDGAPLFVTAPLLLKSHITLSIAPGTTLAGSTDHGDYADKIEFKDQGKQALITASNAEDITIDGGGVIDGRGESWWPKPHDPRPRLIVFDHCKHILMQNITVENSPMWQIVPYYSDDLTFRNMKVLAPQHSHNTDGIDPFSSSHILVDHVTIDTGDDNVAIKSGQPGSPGPDAPSRDIVVTNCTFLHGHGLSIGSEIAGGVQNIRAEHITFKDTDQGIRVKSNRDRGNANIGNFLFRDITMEDVRTPILISEFYPKVPDVITTEKVTRLTPFFHDITIENVTAVGAKRAAIIVGLPESPIRNLKLVNVHLAGVLGATIQYADVIAKNFTVKAQDGKNIQVGAGVSGSLK